MAALLSIEKPLDAEPAQRRRAQVGRWAAHIRIQWPDGVERHPRLADRVQSELGRPCGLDVDYDGLWLTCAVNGSSSSAAGADAGLLASEILTAVGLDRSALRECELVAIEAAPESRPALRLVPDLD